MFSRSTRTATLWGIPSSKSEGGPQRNLAGIGPTELGSGRKSEAPAQADTGYPNSEVLGRPGRALPGLVMKHNPVRHCGRRPIGPPTTATGQDAETRPRPQNTASALARAPSMSASTSELDREPPPPDPSNWRHRRLSAPRPGWRAQHSNQPRAAALPHLEAPPHATEPEAPSTSPSLCGMMPPLDPGKPGNCARPLVPGKACSTSAHTCFLKATATIPRTRVVQNKNIVLFSR